MFSGRAQWLDAVFDHSREAAFPLLRACWIGALYVLGVAAWGYVLGWSVLPLNFGDWADINVPRLWFLSNAIAAGEWPLHMAYSHSLHSVTDRFLTLPDVITTPQSVLLPWLGIQRFILFDVLLHYSAAVAGLLALRRRLAWSLFTYTTVSVLFLFNGHIVSHYSVGHFTWAAYFLFPWFVLLCFDLLDGAQGWRWVARVAFLLFYMVLAGGQHHFTWTLLLLGCLIPFCLDRAIWIIAAGAAAGLLSAVRLLPPVLSLGLFKDAAWMSDVIGYPSILHIVTSMVELRRENLAAASLQTIGNFVFFEVNYFEYAYYVGVVGFAVLVYFGIFSWLRDRESRYPQLIVPTLALTAMSIGTVYRIVRATGIPLLMSERLVSRMLSLPMTFLIVMAGIFLQQALAQTRQTLWNRLAALGVLLLLAIDMAGGLRLMRAAETAKMMRQVELTPAMGEITHRDDPVYTRTVAFGTGLTFITAGGLIVLARRDVNLRFDRS
jgi:hypothetical protein